MKWLRFLTNILIPKCINSNYMLFGYVDFMGRDKFIWTHVDEIYCWETLHTKEQFIEMMRDRLVYKYGQWER